MGKHLKTAALLSASAITPPRGVLSVRAEGPPAIPRADGNNTADVLNSLGQAWAQFQQIHAQQADELRRGLDDVVRREQLDALNTRIGELQAAADQLATVQAAARLGAGDQATGINGRPLTDQQRQHFTVFSDWARGRVDDNALRQVQAAMHRESDTDGGFLVPEQIDREIIRILGTVSVMRQIATVRSIGAGTLRRPIQTQGAAGGWVGERDARPETTAPKFMEQTIDTHEMYANPAATQLLIDDAFFNIETWLPQEVNVTFDELEGAAFISGNGVLKPMGLLSYSTVLAGSWAWGSVTHVISGGAADFAATDPADALINLQTALKPGYLGNARWLMNRATQAKVRLFKDGNDQYLWAPGLQAGVPATLLGHPISADDNMPNVGAGTLPIAFGDFRRAYLILDRIGTRVLRDPYTNKPYIHFYVTRRVGGAVQDFDAFKVLKISA
jgi:HK97 family phage major capsid protein